MRKHQPPAVDTTSVINEARSQFGSACYLIDDKGVAYGPELIDWQAHYDFAPGRWWCDARVKFDAPPGAYSGYRTAADDGTTRRLGTFHGPVYSMAWSSIAVSLSTR